MYSLAALFAAVQRAWTVRGTESCPGQEGVQAPGLCTSVTGVRRRVPAFQERGRRAEDIGVLGARAVWGHGPVSFLSAAPRRCPVSWAGEQVGPGRNARRGHILRAGTDPETGNWIPQVSESRLSLPLSFCR